MMGKTVDTGFDVFK